MQAYMLSTLRVWSLLFVKDVGWQKAKKNVEEREEYLMKKGNDTERKNERDKKEGWKL
jgi:hypothetical protein